MGDPALALIERFYDAVPRSHARAEPYGPLTLFVREGAGWPYYARPARHGAPPRVDDVRAVLRRQSELGVPPAFEWVVDLAPTMAGAAREAGLVVQLCPLLVLDGPPVQRQVETDVRVLTGDETDLVQYEAVAHVAFGVGSGTGTSGTAERAAAAAALAPDVVAGLRSRLRDGSVARVGAVQDGAGPVSVGGYQHALGVAEITGVATLPMARRRGLAGAVTARLADLALSRGLGTVFLSAQDEDAARVYEAVGFRRLATSGLAEPG